MPTYAWIGFLRPEIDSILPSVQQESTDFVSQPIIKIQMLGPMLDAAGKRRGMLMIFEDQNFEAAQDFVRDSPYLKEGLYEEYHLYEYSDEAG